MQSITIEPVVLLVAADRAEDLADDLVGKRIAAARPNSQPPCQLERDPALHAAALNDDDVLFDGIERLLANLFGEGVR